MHTAGVIILAFSQSPPGRYHVPREGKCREVGSIQRRAREMKNGLHEMNLKKNKT
jgi:hypothetical protein